MAAKPLSISVPLPLSAQNANLSPTVYHRSPTSDSPIFDIPEFPALRRVKPLPKRRRVNNDDDDDAVPRCVLFFFVIITIDMLQAQDICC